MVLAECGSPHAHAISVVALKVITRIHVQSGKRMAQNRQCARSSDSRMGMPGTK
jgi:hypothetical protein